MTNSYALSYYPRPDFLAGVLTVLMSGLHQGATLFAPRRQGKTTFVTNELIPAGREVGWQVIYLDLWRLRSDPATGLVEGLEAHAFKQPSGFLAKWKIARVTGTAKATGPELKIEAEPDKPAPPVSTNAPQENRLAAALDALVARSEITLLVLDEFQALAGIDRDDFVAAFRTALQEHRGKLLVFYTGSSRAALNDMFRRAKAPLFQSAHSLVLPELDDGFVIDRVEFLRERTGIEADAEELKSAFVRLGRSPEFLNDLIVNMMVRGDNDIPASLSAWLEKQRTELFDKAFDGLKDIDIALLMTLALPDHPPSFSAEGVKAVQQFCGPDLTVTTSKIQTSMRRLEKQGLVAPTGNKGEYEIEDRSLMIWMRESINSGAELT